MYKSYQFKHNVKDRDVVSVSNVSVSRRSGDAF
jgi:hypothetical protein